MIGIPPAGSERDKGSSSYSIARMLSLERDGVETTQRIIGMEARLITHFIWVGASVLGLQWR